MITELKTFIAVCQHGTFAAAGDRIGLSPSAVSGQIKRLEDSLGFRLFDRTAHSATLNASGQKTLERAETLCALYEKLGDASDDAAANSLLRIGVIASAQQTWVARALEHLRRSFPRVRVHITLGTSMELLDHLDARKLDAAVMVRPPLDTGFDMRWHALVSEPFVLVVPANPNLTGDWKSLIEAQPFLRYDRESFGGRMVERFLRNERLCVNDAIEIDEIPGLIDLVARGLGVALVPLVQARPLLTENVRVMSLEASTFYREIGLLTPRRPDSHAIIAHFSNFLRDAAAFDASHASRASKTASTSISKPIKLD